MVDLVKVRFTRNEVVRVHGFTHPDNPTFSQGKEYDLKYDSAMRWLRRGAVELVTEKPKAKEKADGDKAPAIEAAAAPKADGNDGSDKSPADNRRSRKAVSRNNG